MMNSLPSYPAAKMKVILIILAVIIAFPLIIFATAFFATAAPAKSADAFLKLLATDSAAAYEQMTSVDFKAATSAEQFNAFLVNYPILTGVSESTFSDRSVENGSATVSGTITSSDGSTSPITIMLVQEGDEWKIYNLDLAPLTVAPGA